MSTLLILGSKPDPVLPAKSTYDDLACANASGYSAAKHNLPVPEYTVMTAVLTHRDSGKQSLKALSGLETNRLYFLPRPDKRRGFLKRVIHHLKSLDMSPIYLRYKLWRLNYNYKVFLNQHYSYYDRLLKELCDYDEKILTQIQKKRPSTGIITLIIGLAQQQYRRFIISGFSFELTHPYAINPEIEESGTRISKHANTDVIVVAYLAGKFGNIYTTELIVHERAGIPLFRDN